MGYATHQHTDGFSILNWLRLKTLFFLLENERPITDTQTRKACLDCLFRLRKQIIQPFLTFRSVVVILDYLLLIGTSGPTPLRSSSVISKNSRFTKPRRPCLAVLKFFQKENLLPFYPPQSHILHSVHQKLLALRSKDKYPNEAWILKISY